MNGRAWKVFPRPLLETVLRSYGQQHRVPQPLIFHGPKGVGKTTLICQRLLEEWNKPPHITGYVDFNVQQSPWCTGPCPGPSLSSLRTELEQCLESMVYHALRLGAISGSQIFSTMNKWHGLNGALKHILGSKHQTKNNVATSVLWSRAVLMLGSKAKSEEINSLFSLSQEGKSKVVALEQASYLHEAVLSLHLAKEVIGLHKKWRANSVAHLNRVGGFSRSLANSATDWPCLLVELLSSAAEIDFFQPKLIINNIDALRRAVLKDDSTINARLYHDSFIWRIIGLGVNERCLPVILMTSDSYYSYRAFMDFGFPDIFISRETFGWTPQEAKLHMISNYFSDSEWAVISEVFGQNLRHLSELYTLKQRAHFEKILEERGYGFEDVVDAYLAHLQMTEVNPAMDMALSIVEKFVFDVHGGKISADQLRFGAPWRHPPSPDSPSQCFKWAKLQLIDYVHSLVNTEFGINYLADCSLEILDDPCTNALLEVGLLYAQRDPSYIRPISPGIQRCLVRWFVLEQTKMTFYETLVYRWHRVFRGRSYRHLMKEVGYK